MASQLTKLRGIDPPNKKLKSYTIAFLDFMGQLKQEVEMVMMFTAKTDKAENKISKIPFKQISCSKASA